MGKLNSIGLDLYGKFTKMKWHEKLCNYCSSDPIGSAAKLTVASVILKDGVNCGIYTYQSMHNQRIPDDQRPYVAAFDLVNGLLLMAVQLSVAGLVDKHSPKVFAKMFGRVFDKYGRAKKRYVTQVRSSQAKEGFLPTRKYALNNEYEKLRGDAEKAFSGVATLVATTIVAKRMIVPFMATPLSSALVGWVKKMKGVDTADKAKTAETKPAEDVQPKVYTAYNQKKFDNSEVPPVYRKMMLK